MLFAYFGPETMMPLASIFAAAGGVILMFWRNIVGFGRKLYRLVRPQKRLEHATVTPVNDPSQPGSTQLTAATEMSETRAS
jgi:hypothetical protein